VIKTTANTFRPITLAAQNALLEPQRTPAKASTQTPLLRAASRLPIQRFDFQPQGTRLDNALRSVDVEQIRRDVIHIASDEMGGRDTPSAGLTKTAEYLRDRLLTWGWQPGASEESYFYPYTLRSFILNNGLSQLTFTSGKQDTILNHGEDYFYTEVKNKTDLDFSGDAVFLGEGTEQDFRTASIQNKWVICLDSAVDPAKRREWAQRHGARGVIVIPHDDMTDTHYFQKIETLRKLAQDGDLKYPDCCDIDEIFIAPHAAQKLMASIKPEYYGAGSFPPVLFSEQRTLQATSTAVKADNVVGFWPGSDPEVADEVIILSAHYDHLGSRWGSIYNGADDNASGTAGLLALAEAIAKLNPRRSIMIMWVSGEEKGLLGSKAWVDNPYLPQDAKPVANINIDMIGRNNPDNLLFTPTRAHPQYNHLSELAESLFPKEGFSELGSADRYYRRSDHYSFAQLGIPVIFITAGTHDDYHQPSDTAEKIEYDKLRRTVRLVVRMLDSL